MPHDVFLSYSRRDRDQALVVRNRLGQEKFSIFFDENSLMAGVSWINTIEEQISNSQAIVILLGPAGLGNTQQYEREYALHRAIKDPGFRVIPVLLPGCVGLPPGFLALKMWVDFRGHDALSETAREFTKLIEAIRGDAAGETAEDVCPYVGLETFREEDEEFFCGRDDEIRELEQKLRAHNLVSVVGPSGSGKSSLVQAGLIPRLRRQQPKKPWRVITLKPGPYPFQRLVSELNLSNVALNPVARAEAQGKASNLLRPDELRSDLGSAATTLLGDGHKSKFRTLIHIDAWEELYAAQNYGHGTDSASDREPERSAFIDFLLAASETQRAKVVVTVRADAYATLLRHPRLSRLWPEQQVNLRPMSREGLRDAIIKPVNKAGLDFESDALVDEILADVLRETDGLPLLQVALKETWKERKEGILTRSGYIASGKVSGVLNRTAEQFYSKLTELEKKELPRLLLSMIASSENGFATLVRAPLPTDSLQRAIVDRMSAADTRLLVVGIISGPPTGSDAISVQPSKVVEIAHASLLRTWLRLRDWVTASADWLKLKSEFRRMKDDWEKSGRSPGSLITSPFQLEKARDLLANPGHVPTDDLKEYVETSSEQQKQREEEAFRAEALQHAQRIEAATHDIIESENEMQEFVDDMKRRFGFDFALLQLVDRCDSTIATVAGSGLREDWIGLGKHYLHGNGATPDIQAYIATAEPPVIEVITGNDRRFDNYIFKKFGHARMSRAFIPIVLCDNQSAVMGLRWTVTRTTPNADASDANDRRTLFTVDAREYEDFKRFNSARIIGTLEVGFYNHAHRLIADEAVSIFKRAARRALGLHDVSLDAVLHTVAEVAVNMVNADAAAIGMHFDPGRQAFAFKAHVGVGVPPNAANAIDVISKLAQKHHKALIVPATDGASDGVSPELEEALSAGGFRAMVAVPIGGGGKTRAAEGFDGEDVAARRANGALCVFFARNHETLSRELAWLEYLARRTADSVRYVQYIIKMNEDERQLSKLHRVSVRLSRDYLKEGLLDEIAGSAANIFAADLVTVFEFSEFDRLFLESIGISGQLIRPDHHIGCCTDETFAPRRLVARGENLYTSNVSGDRVLFPSLGIGASGVDRFLIREEISSVAGVILRAAEEVVGVMFVNFRRPHLFEQKEKDMIETLAATAAIAIKNRRVVAGHDRRFGDAPERSGAGAPIRSRARVGAGRRG